MFTRAGRAAMFDKDAFTEAFFDDEAMADGAIVVALVGLVTYLGVTLIGGFSFSVAGVLGSLITPIISWLILGFATWFAAARMFGATGRPQTLIALQGLAALPLLLEIGGEVAGAVGLVWYLAVLVIATKVATDLITRNAALAVLIGFALAVLVRALISAPFRALSAIF